MTRIPDTLRRLVYERANGCCEYCRLAESDSFLAHEVDHITAEKHQGMTEESNLCYSCFDCNRYKGSDIASVDPETGEITPLFHPRRDSWIEHFRLEATFIRSISAKRRVTVNLLKLNAAEQISRRESLLLMNRYPC